MTAETARQTMNAKPVFTIPGKGIINFKSLFGKKLLCDGLTFSAGSACAYSCAFCYVESMQVKNWNDPKNEAWKAIRDQAPEGKFENVVIRRAGALEAMRNQLMPFGKARIKEDPNDRRVIYSSPLVDVAANMELVRETIEACKLILELTNWQIRLLSKSNLLPQVARGLLNEANTSATAFRRVDVYERMIFGVSTGTLDDKLAGSFEIGTAKVSKRIESLHWLQDHGFRTYGMICPSLPQRHYDLFAASMAVEIRWEKCEHVWAEVINVRGESMIRTCEALRAGGYKWEADKLEDAAANKEEWEDYARQTFEGHAAIYGQSGKLRFLQYVNNSNRDYWTSKKDSGAVLL